MFQNYKDYIEAEWYFQISKFSKGATERAHIKYTFMWQIGMSRQLASL